ncbi:MAG: heat-inducible transcriptional repressor [Thermotogota bacterium]|nr:heat-inducible transcriptional repressor [Thermotogota bacterium]
MDSNTSIDPLLFEELDNPVTSVVAYISNLMAGVLSMRKHHHTGELNERQRKVLYCIVKEYIRTRAPVSSAKVLDVSNINYSSATIRNDMKKLEYLGYLYQPHTSAGRIPTDRGYRFYIDSIRNLKEEVTDTSSNIDTFHALKIVDASNVLKRATRMLARALKGVVAFQKPQTTELRIVKVVVTPLAGGYVLITVITEMGMHVAQLVKTEQQLSSEELFELSRLMSERLSGRTLNELKEIISKYELATEIWYDRKVEGLLQLLIALVSQEFEEGFEKHGLEYLVGDETLSIQDLRNVSIILGNDRRLKEIAQSLYKKTPRTVQIYVGGEHGISELKNFSIAVSTYRKMANVLGYVLIILPKAVPYEKVIGYTEYMVNRVTEVFSAEEVL